MYSNKIKTEGSDNSFHLKLIYSIKNNGRRFINYNPFRYNEKRFSYPQFFHFLLTFLPEKLYTSNTKHINYYIKIFEVLFFNAFIFYLYKVFAFDFKVFLYANIVVNLFPFSYAVWNAKNTGLSARHFGLVLGQIYTYLIVIYVLSNNYVILFFLFFVVFIVLLSSQFALQFILFSMPFVAFFLKIPEIIIFPFLAYFVFYLLMPEIAKNFIVGQYNHKRNFALFSSELVLFGSRPSVWRDFIFDFWIKLKNESNKYKVFYYISKNPVVEAIYGFPYLGFVFYIFFAKESLLFEELHYLIKVIIAAFWVFLLTTFRKTRFLGEPQRYLEFVIPLITIVFVITFSTFSMLLFALVSILLIVFYKLAYKKSNTIQTKKNFYHEICSYLYEKHKTGKIAISNDGELLRFILAYNFEIIMPPLYQFYKNKTDMNIQYFNNNKSLSPHFLCVSIEEYKPEILIINRDIFTSDFLEQEQPGCTKDYTFDNTILNCDIYIRKS